VQTLGLQFVSPTHRWFSQTKPLAHGAVQLMAPPQASPRVPPQYWPPVGLHVFLLHVEPPMHKWLVHDQPSGQALLQVRVPPQPSPSPPPQYCPPVGLHVSAVQPEAGTH